MEERDDLKVTIEKVQNGYIISYRDAEGRASKEVFEQIEDYSSDDDEIEHYIRMLHSLECIIGPSTSKYSKKRVRVLSMPGDCYSGKFDENYIKELKWLKEEIEEILSGEHNTEE